MGLDRHVILANKREREVFKFCVWSLRNAIGSPGDHPVIYFIMDIFRMDGNSRADALKRVVDLLSNARHSSGDGDPLPKRPTTSHAAMALSIAKGFSIEEVAKESGLSKRSCDRYRYSPALRLVVSDLQRQYYDAKLADSGEDILRAVPDAIQTMISAAKAGNITAAREILRLSNMNSHDSYLTKPDTALEVPDMTEEVVSTLPSGNPSTSHDPTLHDRATQTSTPSQLQHDRLPPATLSKAEEHPSPDLSYIHAIEPMWTVEPVMENDNSPTKTDQINSEH